MTRPEELTEENARLREANRRLQQEGPALERDKLVIELRAEVTTANERAERHIRYWNEAIKQRDATQKENDALRATLASVKTLADTAKTVRDEGQPAIALGYCIGTGGILYVVERALASHKEGVAFHVKQMHARER